MFQQQNNDINRTDFETEEDDDDDDNKDTAMSNKNFIRHY